MNANVVSRKTAIAARHAVQVVAVANQKGGVGKTTVGFHLAMAAADAGKRTLVVDGDTQGNLSQVLTGDLAINRRMEGGASHLFDSAPFSPELASATLYPNVSLLHGHGALEMFDNDGAVFDRVMSADFRGMLHRLDFDVIIVDTPPAVGVRQLAPLAWADKVVIPMEPVNAAFAGFQAVLESLGMIRNALNPGVKWVGVLNRLNASSKSHREMEAFVRGKYGSQIAPTLSSRTAVTDAMQQDMPVPVWRLKGARRDVKELWHGLCGELIG